MLSQYAHEREVLFPPCTMLEVINDPKTGGQPMPPPTRTDSEGQRMPVTYVDIEVRPNFI